VKPPFLGFLIPMLFTLVNLIKNEQSRSKTSVPDVYKRNVGAGPNLVSWFKNIMNALTKNIEVITGF
jgi:hypothetical protein